MLYCNNIIYILNNIYYDHLYLINKAMSSATAIPLDANHVVSLLFIKIVSLLYRYIIYMFMLYTI
jgi:hypothetical protein